MIAERTSGPGQEKSPVDLDRWFEFSDQKDGYLYPRDMLFDAAGAHPACVWHDAEDHARPSQVFLEAYRNHASLKYGVDLPLGKTRSDEPGRLKDVCANGYWNDPPFPELDYQAFVKDLFERFLHMGWSPDGVYLSIDIDKGYLGYRLDASVTSGSIPGVYRSGAIYYDPSSPDHPYNCSRAAYLEGQRLQLQMCKLAELIRQESTRRFGSAPAIGWHEQITIPQRLRIDENGRLDGTGRTPPNRLWRDLTEEQKDLVLNRMMVNCRPLMSGGVLVDDGVRYPGLDVLELNAQQLAEHELNPVKWGGGTEVVNSKELALGNRIQRTIDLGRRLLEERRSGVQIPPVIVSSSWTFNEELDSPEEGKIMPESQVRRVLADAYGELEVSGYLMFDFAWAQIISSCFNLETPSWEQLDQRQRRLANDAWRSIWSIIVARKGAAVLPRYRPTARETIGDGGFSDNLAIRNAWLTAHVRFLERTFGEPLSKASHGVRIGH
ncbi:MAG: hypothetical protein VX641_06500 [Planctomycetota bacterium]|nr:hypothetical protein [Planctomycetota bacterium]